MSDDQPILFFGPVVRATLEKLSPASRAAYEAACKDMLRVALAGERARPGDDFLKFSKEAHYDHANQHLTRALFRAGVISEDPVTGLPDLAHSTWRIALMAEAQRREPATENKEWCSLDGCGGEP